MSISPRSDSDKRPSSVDRRWALVAIGVAVALLAVLVGVYEFGPGRTSSPSASVGDQSAYAQLFDEVGPNGEVTKEMALEAFSLAIAPLPGVAVPTGTQPTDPERTDGTFAVDWLWPYMNQLTVDQTAVVNAALAPDPAAPVITPALAAAVLIRPDLTALAQDPSQDQLRSLASQAQQAITAKLGRSLGMGWRLTLNNTEIQANKTHAYAYTAPITNGGTLLWGTYPECSIHVNPSLSGVGDLLFTKATIAHEMFHCFQDDLISKLGKGNLSVSGPPGWIMEGQAQWVGENIAGPTFDGGAKWGSYLTTPEYSLFVREYDAVGFYQHMSEEGIDPWGRFDAMITAWEGGSSGSGANSDAFKAAGALADTFLDTWASGFFRDPSLGDAWYAQGPWTVHVAANIHEVTLAPGDVQSRAAPPVTSQLWTVTSASDIVEVHGQNRVRMHVGSLPELPVEQRWLCTKSGGCECPPGKSYSGPDLENTGGETEIDFGITGSLAASSVTVTGHSLDEFCKPQPSEQPLSPCTSNCGHSNGDPHLRTTNRYKYDFQAAGEFVLLRNADSSIEVQARQEPYNGTLGGSFKAVSTNTAISMRDNGHVVGVYGTPGGLAVHVDGSQVDPAALPDLGSGASVKPINNGYRINFPDGSAVSALSVGEWGINAVVQASDALRSSGVGLIGPITPGGMGVPALPDGTQLPAVPDAATRDKILYGTFADAWRVTDATSLFDYDPGKSTESYTDRNFPSDADQSALAASLASPDPSRQAAAQTACANVTDPDLLSECEFDVYATNDDGFAQQYVVTQDLYDSGIVTPTGQPSLAPASPGGVVGATKVIELHHLQSATIGPDGTLYASIVDPSSQPQLIAVDPITGAVKQQTPMRVETDIHFGAGSVWASGQLVDANQHICSVTRYDPQTLAKQGDFPIPCSGFGPPKLTSMGDALWFVDTTKTDPNTGAGTALTRIDPSTSTPSSTSVPLPQAGGCCLDSQGAVFCYCGNSDIWRLTANDAAFVDLGNYNSVAPAGTGFWAEQNDSAVYVDSPSGPQASVPLGDGRIVGGDPTGVYLQSTNVQAGITSIPLQRYPADGSAPVTLATAPTVGSDIYQTQLDYLTGGFPWFATAQGYLHLWEFKETPDSHDALWLQWAPLP